ncbi:hypothetical protein BC828DRAFT_417318 [Blastocladiella britannica]|nr:hypothetical protein BC828DRAFT_417318 [Blastocladiella britannica]
MGAFDDLLSKSTKFDAELDSLFASSKVKSALPVAPPKAPAAAAKPATAAPLSRKRAAAEVESDSDDSYDSDDDKDEEDDDEEAKSDDEDEDDQDSDAASDDEDEEDEGDQAELAAAAALGRPVTKKQSDKERLQRTVFVGNVPLVASEKEHFKDFKQFFNAHSEVESIRFRSITFNDALPRKINFKLKNFHPGRDTCNAYVVFKSAAGAIKAAAAVHSTVFEGKHLRVDYLGVPPPAVRNSSGGGDADAVSTAPAEAAVRVPKRDVKRCVFVGNVPFDLEDEPLWEFFGQAGDVESVRVIRDRKVGLGKGFAYVQFKERASVPLAIKLHGTDFKGKPIRVMKCHKLENEGQGDARPQGVARRLRIPLKANEAPPPTASRDSNDSRGDPRFSSSSRGGSRGGGRGGSSRGGFRGGRGGGRGGSYGGSNGSSRSSDDRGGSSRGGFRGGRGGAAAPCATSG